MEGNNTAQQSCLAKFWNWWRPDKDVILSAAAVILLARSLVFHWKIASRLACWALCLFGITYLPYVYDGSTEIVTGVTAFYVIILNLVFWAYTSGDATFGLPDRNSSYRDDDQTFIARSTPTKTSVLIGVLTWLIVLVIFSYAIIFQCLELKSGPTDHQHINSLFENFYFSAVTFATLGYGDISPQTSPQRIVALLEVFNGLAIFGIFIARITNILQSNQSVSSQPALKAAEKTEQ